MPDSFVTWEEKRNNFTFDKKKEKYGQGKSKEGVGSKKAVLPHTFWVLKFLTLFNNNCTSLSVRIKFVSGDSFNFTFLFGGIFYQMCVCHMSETFAAWEEQRNNFAFGEEKEKYV